MESFNWQVIRKISLLVLLELFDGCPQNLNAFTQMYGGTYGHVEREENFLDDVQIQNQGVILFNPDALQSQLLQDYMDVEDTDELEVLESLKDPEFLN